jgi:hypothetical protein
VKSKTKSRTPVGPLITKEKRIISDNKEMAEVLNQFFSSVFTREDLISIPEAEIENVRQVMPPIRVSKWEVQKKMRGLRRGRSRRDKTTAPKGL